jgi:hypothetical protein
MQKFFSSVALSIAAVSIAGAAMAEMVTFDSDALGAPPSGWTVGVTGRGAPRWIIEADDSAPSRDRVLKQSGQGDFPWCVKDTPLLADGRLEVKFKALSGKTDQAGGLVWRWKDGNNYYVARANALENNVSLYYTQGGRRITIKYVEAPVARNRWHTLSVEFVGTRIRVALNGRDYIDLEDAHITGEGRVGVWTKADSVTSFDDFKVEPSTTK